MAVTRSLLMVLTVILGLATGPVPGAVAASPPGGCPVVDLGTLPGGDYSGASFITDSGVIVGGASVGPASSGISHAVRWDRSGRISDLGTLPGYDNSVPIAVNDRGFVIGYVYSNSDGLFRAVRWDPQGHIMALGLLPGTVESRAVGINAEGVSVGWFRDGITYHAVRWDRAGRPSELPALGSGGSIASGINDEGTVVGYASGNGYTEAVSWDRAGRITRLAPNQNGYARLISDSGFIVGETYDNGRVVVVWDPHGRPTTLQGPAAQIYVDGISDNGVSTGTTVQPAPQGGLRELAVRWDRDGRLVELATLPDHPNDTTFPSAANDHGIAVGRSGNSVSPPWVAVKWNERGQIIVLGDLGGSSGAVGVNEHGAIVGSSQTPSGAWHAVLWRCR